MGTRSFSAVLISLAAGSLIAAGTATRPAPRGAGGVVGGGATRAATTRAATSRAAAAQAATGPVVNFAAILPVPTLPHGAWPVREQKWDLPVKPLTTGEPAIMEGGLYREILGMYYGETDAAFSPDSKQVAACGVNGSGGVWDVATGREICAFKQTDILYRIAFSPDGKSLFTAGNDHTARRWDAATGKQLQLFKAHTMAVSGVAFDAATNILLTSSFDKTAILWDAATGKVKQTVQLDNMGTACVFHPDGKSIFLGTCKAGPADADGVVLQYDLSNMQVIKTFSGPKFAVNDIRISADGKKMVTASRDETTVFDIESGHVDRKMTAYGRINLDARVSATRDFSRIYPCSGAASLSAMDLQGKTVSNVSLESENIHGISVSPDDRYVAVATGGVWAEVMNALPQYPGESHGLYLFDRKAMEQSVGSGVDQQQIDGLASLPGNRAALLKGSKLLIWDVKADKSLKEVELGKNVRSISASPDGALVAAIIRDGSIQLVNTAAGQVTSLKGHSKEATGLVFTKDHATLYSSSGDGKIIAWTTATAAQAFTLGKGDKPVGGIALVNDDKELLAAIDGNLVRWKLADKSIVSDAAQQFDRNKESWKISGIGGSTRPDMALLLFADAKKNPEHCAVFLNLAKMELVSGLVKIGVGLSNTAALALPDGRLLANGGIRGDLGDLHDVKENTPGWFMGVPSTGGNGILAYAYQRNIAEFPVPFGGARTVRGISADRKFMITGDDNSVGVWNTATGEMVHRLAPSDSDQPDWHFMKAVISGDSSRVAANGTDSPLYVWDLKTGAQKAFSGFDNTFGLAISPDGKLFATTPRFARAREPRDPVRVVDIATGNGLASFPPLATICDVTFSPDNRYVMVDNVAINDLPRPTVMVWDMQQKKQVLNLTGEYVSKWPPVMLKDGALLLSNQPDAVRLVSFAKGAVWSVPRTQMPGLGAVVSPNGAWALIFCQDKTVRLVDMRNGKEVNQWKTTSMSPDPLGFTPDSQAMLLLDNQSYIVWNPATNKETLRREIRIQFLGRPLVLPDNTLAVMDSDVLHPVIIPLAGPKLVPVASTTLPAGLSPPAASRPASAPGTSQPATTRGSGGGPAAPRGSATAPAATRGAATTRAPATQR